LRAAVATKRPPAPFGAAERRWTAAASIGTPPAPAARRTRSARHAAHLRLLMALVREWPRGAERNDCSGVARERGNRKYVQIVEWSGARREQAGAWDMLVAAVALRNSVDDAHCRAAAAMPSVEYVPSSG
jgi:hypothetical protein